MAGLVDKCNITSAKGATCPSKEEIVPKKAREEKKISVHLLKPLVRGAPAKANSAGIASKRGMNAQDGQQVHGK